MIHNAFNRFLFAEVADDTLAAGGVGGEAAKTGADAAGTSTEAQQQAAAAGGDATTDDAATAAAKAATASQATGERPEYIPEKFWKDGKVDEVAWGKAHKELEKTLHTRFPEMADIPADPAGYTLKPEKLPEGLVFTDEMNAEVSRLFHAHGITNKAGKEIVAGYMAMQEANLKAATEAYEKQLETDRAALVTEWGGKDKYEARVAEITGVVSKAGYDITDPAIFSNPKVVGFLGKMVGMLGEEARAAIKGGIAPNASLVNGQEEAQKIMKDATHPENAAYLAGDAAVVAKVKRLIDGK